MIEEHSDASYVGGNDYKDRCTIDELRDLQRQIIKLTERVKKLEEK